MVGFKIQIQGLKEVEEKLKKLASNNLEVPLKIAGNNLVRFAKNNIRNSVDPDGNPYKPLSQITIDKRRKGKKGSRYSDIPLRDTGQLFSSLTSNVKNNELEVGTNIEYAKIHQFGGPSKIEVKDEFGQLKWKTIQVPARPFLGVPPGFDVILPKIFQDYYKKIMRD